MDDIASKITELLNDPEGMQKISSMANTLMQSNNDNTNNISDIISAVNTKQNEDNSADNFSIDPMQMGNIMKMMSLIKQQNTDDDNTRLLLALKPHLSDERKKKVDKALSLLKIAKLLPVLKESGIMNLLGGWFFARLFT